VIKIYSLITDIFLTYVLLVLICPLFLLDTFVLTLSKEGANAISEYFSYSESAQSFIPFFIVWYVFSFIQTLIFGTTLGQFLLGLRNFTQEESRKFTFFKLFFLRIKTLIFSLVLIPGQSYISHNSFFKAVRKVGLIFILIFSWLSPLLLQTSEKVTPISIIPENQIKKLKTLQTRSLSSYSQSLGIELKTEQTPRYFLLPLMSAKRSDEIHRGFQFIDLKTNSQITIQEIGHIDYTEIEDRLEYANPFFSQLHHGAISKKSPQLIKELIVQGLKISPLSFTKAIQHFGPFFGSAILLNEEIIGRFKSDEQSLTSPVVKFFHANSPFFVIRYGKIDLLYFFTERSISILSIPATNPVLTEAFHDEILSALKFSPGHQAPTIKSIGILEAMDAFLSGDERSFLTYYINEANKLTQTPLIIDGTNLSESSKNFIAQNITLNQKIIRNKDIFKLFNDLKIVLTTTAEKSP
jgi:hypothetical protein